MLLFAAFAEAFWSSTGSIPGPVKFAVGGVMWALVLGWLALAGRGKAASGALRRLSNRCASKCARARRGNRSKWASRLTSATVRRSEYLDSLWSGRVLFGLTLPP